jgi:hypothetical protein
MGERRHNRENSAPVVDEAKLPRWRVATPDGQIAVVYARTKSEARARARQVWCMRLPVGTKVTREDK